MWAYISNQITFEPIKCRSWYFQKSEKYLRTLDSQNINTRKCQFFQVGPSPDQLENTNNFPNSYQKDPEFNIGTKRLPEMLFKCMYEHFPPYITENTRYFWPLTDSRKPQKGYGARFSWNYAILKEPWLKMEFPNFLLVFCIVFLYNSTKLVYKFGGGL